MPGDFTSNNAGCSRRYRTLISCNSTKAGNVGLFLYLRSFRLGRSTLLRRLVPWAYGDRSLLDASIPGAAAFHFEEDISNAIGPHGLLIAIGDRNDSYGAGKIIVNDEKWKDHFHWLATHSWTIFMQPDLTPSVRWEIGQLVANMSYLRKTVWVMPRSGGDTVDRDPRRLATGYRRDPAPTPCRRRHVPSAPRPWRCPGRPKRVHIDPDPCA